MANSDNNLLGNYLKDRRARLNPAEFGFSSTRRRTPGLRREEVAQRANVSATWYTWLEQGRGGTPSASVLEGLANALALGDAEREHLFLLAQHLPPQNHNHASEGVSPQLQRVLDSLEFSPAIVKTVEWDVVAWNRAAALVLGDYAQLAPEERNLLRLLFSQPHSDARFLDWENHVRAAVAGFRADITRLGTTERAAALIAELLDSSPEFEAIWREHDVQSHGEGIKHFNNSPVGPISLEYSSFTVDGRPDLSLLIFTPATPEDTTRVRSRLKEAV